MNSIRERVGASLHQAALRLVRQDPKTVFQFYLLPATGATAVAKVRPFGMSYDFAGSLAMAALAYMFVPAAVLLVRNLIRGEAGFRLQVFLIVVAIVVVAAGLAVGLAYVVPMPTGR